MSLEVASFTLRADDPDELAGFYAQLLGGEVTVSGVWRYVRHAGHPLILVTAGDVRRAGDPAMHPDLMCGFGQREAEVQRAVALGARRQWDVLDEADDIEWTALRDPEGNLFCVVAPKA